MATVFMAGLQFLPFNMSPENETGLSVRDDGAFFTALHFFSVPRFKDQTLLSGLVGGIDQGHTHVHTHTHAHTHRHACALGMGKVFEVGSCTDTRGQPCCYDLASAAWRK